MKYSEAKLLFELFDGDKERVMLALRSIKNGFVTLDELESNDYIYDSVNYYSSNDYVQVHNGTIYHRDDTMWCEGNAEFYHVDYMVMVYQGRSEAWYSRMYVEYESDFSQYRGDYYDDSAMERHGLVHVEDRGEVWHEDDAYYHDGDGWYSYPECDTDDYVRGYHNGEYKLYTFNGNKKYYIGFEIEKEDREALTSVDIDEFENSTDGYWRKEKDGSLDEYCGYELISPTFEFDIPKIFKLIESNDLLVQHINAKYTTSCGGHIHLSEDGLGGNELFEKIKGYTPLLYALYHGRVDRNYCKGKKNDDLQNDDEKYQAIKIHYNRVEFRIISAVPTVKTLKWRCRLIEQILKNPTNDPIKAYYNVDTKFTKLLKEVYSDERLVELKNRFITYTKRFEDLDINN